MSYNNINKNDLRRNRFVCCRYEIGKLLHDKALLIFIALCLCLNICLCFIDNYTRDAVNALSSSDFAQSGEKIFDDLDSSALGAAYYNERYINSSALDRCIKEKYERLQSSVDILDDNNADLSFYAGEFTPAVHTALFEYQLKALTAECIVFLSLLCLRAFSAELRSRTGDIVYSSRRGRDIAIDKIIADGIVGLLYCSALIIASLAVFFKSWNFTGLWDMNVASSFNYIHDTNDAIYMKPFITWADMTVKNYFICSVLLIASILAVWWMISNITALFICNELAGGLFIAALLCLPYFGLMIFPELHLSVPFFISTLTISTVIYYSHMWFTDLGCYTIIEYQEVWITLAHLAVSALLVGCSIKYFKRKELL